ncbi:MAG: hypothetical protein GX974_01915 [Clostridiales bacterium]|nr:hypothetical protein [Clostridiales bacterium]
MEKFAMITFPDSGLKSVQKSRFLERLPKKATTLYKYMIGPQPIDTILDRKSMVELGKIYNIPTLHYNGENFIFERRERQLSLLIKSLKDNDIGILSAPFIHDIFSAREISTLNKNGIYVLDTNHYHILTLYTCMPELIKILGRQLPYIEVGIWRADTELGKAWVHMLSPYINKMTIGGESLDELYTLASKILRGTGLSCQVTTDPSHCMNKKDLLINTEYMPGMEHRGEIDILSYPLDIQKANKALKGLSFYSGNLELPCDAKVNISLNPWEHLALSNSLLYILNGSYRELVLNRTLDKRTFNKFIRIIKKHKLRPRGVANGYEIVSYDRFRMIYYKNSSSSKKVG